MGLNPLGLAADDEATYASIAEHVAALGRGEGEPRLVRRFERRRELQLLVMAPSRWNSYRRSPPRVHPRRRKSVTASIVDENEEPMHSRTLSGDGEAAKVGLVREDDGLVAVCRSCCGVRGETRLAAATPLEVVAAAARRVVAALVLDLSRATKTVSKQSVVLEAYISFSLSSQRAHSVPRPETRLTPSSTNVQLYK